VPRTPKNLVAERLAGIRASATLAVSSQAARLRAEGHDVIAFGAGEPDLETPEPVRDAAIQAIQEGRGRYTAAAGLPELRKAVARKLAASGFDYSWKQVAMSAGAKSAIFESLYVLLNPGEEVIFPSPHWNSYEDMVVAAGGVPVPVPTSRNAGFQVTAEELASKVTPRTKVILVNSPNNPTGAVYTEETLAGIAAVAREYGLAIITDDIYEHLLYTGEPFRNVLSVAPDLAEQTVIVNGFSKSHSMTGWRLGYLAGPSAVVEAVIRLQSQLAGNPNSIAQHGALRGLSQPLDPARVRTYDERRRLMLEGLRAIPGVRCTEPLGAFYTFPDLSAFLGRTHRSVPIESDETLVRLLLEEERVATVPGTAFGAPGHIRLSYACSTPEIEEGLSRIRAFLSRLA